MTCMGLFEQPELNKEQAMVFGSSDGEALGGRNSYEAFLASTGPLLSPFVTLKHRRWTQMHEMAGRECVG